MKKTVVIYLSVIVIFMLASCTSPKEITMFQEAQKAQTRYDIPPKAPDHKIRPFDNLYLSVLTLDPEVNALFNPSSEGDGFSSGTEQMYGSPTSRYINGYLVSENGTVNLPILGDIKLVGLSLDEAQQRLKEKAEEYLVDPTVQVKYLNYKVNVLGEIRNPGIYYNYEGNINILDAISMANGITEYADLEKALIKRQEEDGVKTYEVNLTDNSVYSSNIFFLQPNDLVYIPPSKLKRRQENAQVYNQLLATISTLLVAVALILN